MKDLLTINHILLCYLFYMKLPYIDFIFALSRSTECLSIYVHVILHIPIIILYIHV